MSGNSGAPDGGGSAAGREEFSPALRQCLARSADGFRLGLVQVWRVGGRFRLVHRDDAGRDVGALRPVKLGELRALAQFTADGEYRPLKSTPTLVRGWEAWAEDPVELEAALEELHPGGLADWHAWVSGRPFGSTLREAATRQTGRYRRVLDLGDAELQEGVRSCCVPGRCVKERAWTVPGEALPEAPAEPRLACLDPCPLLWDVLRRAAEGAGG